MTISIRLRIILGFFTIIAILGTVSLVSALRMKGLDSASSDIVARTEIVRLVNEYVATVRAQAAALRTFAYSGQTEDKNTVYEAREKADSLRQKVHALLEQSGDIHQAERLDEAAGQFESVFTGIENRLGNKEDALQVVVVGLGKIQKSSETLTGYLKNMDNEQAKAMASDLPDLVSRFTQYGIAYVASGSKDDFEAAIEAGSKLEEIAKASNILLRNLPRRERAIVRYMRRDGDVIRQSLRAQHATSVGLSEAMSQLAIATAAINHITDRIRSSAQKSQSNALEQMVGQVSKAIDDSFMGLAIGAAVAMLLAWFIGVSIVGPLAKITGAIGKLAAGDKNINIPFSDRRDELGEMASAAAIFKEKAFELEHIAEEKMRSELEAAEVLRKKEIEQAALLEEKRKEEVANRAARQEIRHRQRLAMADDFESRVIGVVEGVRKASKDMMHASKSLVTNTQQTKLQVNNTSAITNEANESVSAVAGSTEELAVSFRSVGDELDQSARIAQEAVQEASHTTDTVKGLTDAAGRIGKVVEMIQEIAEQTNLLALNATIEAARAGDAGRGFAVVAQEVKSLAAQSSEATTEISSYVREIQSVSSEAGNAIGRISDIIGKMDTVTKSVVDVMQHQSSATQEIAANVQQLAAGTSSVLESVDIMGSAAQETEDMSSSLKENADTLMREAEALGVEVNQFLTEVRTDPQGTDSIEETIHRPANSDNVVHLLSA